MVIGSDELASRVLPHGVVRLYPQTGRYDFAQGLRVHRCGLLSGPDGSIREELLPCCYELPDTGVVAASAAGHLAECGVGRLYLLPQVHWEHELLDHQPGLWRRVLGMIGGGFDEGELVGGSAVVLRPGGVPLAAVFGALLEGLTDAGAVVLADRPLVIKIHQHRQIWLSSTDLALLPAAETFGV